MYLSSVEATHVRSIRQAKVLLARDVTLITGPNGAGKTNLLEAVHLLGTLRPLTTSSPAELVTHGEKQLAVEGTLLGGVFPLVVRLTITGSRRHAWVGGKPLRDAEGYLGTLATVAFTPDDLHLVKSGPVQRRSFINRASCELWPAARDELRRYERALRQRAAALRRNARQDVLEAVEAPLRLLATQVWRRRERTLEVVLPHAVRWLSTLLDGRVLDVRLQPGLQGAVNFAQLTDGDRDLALQEGLGQALEEDRRRASTSYGPHHDELDVVLDGQAARRFASQGQQRCAALALTLGVVDAVAAARGRPPLVLLDDVSSELDEMRRRALFEALALARCQVVATATQVDLLPLPASFSGERRHYTAHAGSFEPTG